MFPLSAVPGGVAYPGPGTTVLLSMRIGTAPSVRVLQFESQGGL